MNNDPLIVSNTQGYHGGSGIQDGYNGNENTIVCDTGTTFPYNTVLFWISVSVNALILLYYLWVLCRSIRGGGCRQRCHSLCRSRCCQAAQGGCKSMFVSFRGCLCSMVNCLRSCHRQRWERMEEGAVNVPDIVVEPAVEVREPDRDASCHNADLSGASPSQRIPTQGTSHLPSVIPEAGATGGTGIPPTSHDIEMRIRYAIEARTSLNILHGMLKFPPQMLRIRRKDLVKDVLSSFEDRSLGEKMISTRMIDEDGVDLGGVTRDMLTSFWNKVREIYFPGNEAFIPYIGLASRSKQRDFITLGRIFSHSTATLKSLPIQICRSTLMVIIYDTCDINADTLLEDFLLYLDCEDRELVRCSLNNFVDLGEEGKDKLQRFFSKYGMGINPRAASIREHLINLAQNELCIKPKIFCENMRTGIPSTHMDTFWFTITLQHLEQLYEGFRVIPCNVWSMIRCKIWPIRNPDERRVFGYLRDLIQDLHGENLLSFLQFVTAERKMPSSVITVGFNDTRGLARRPTASTCSCQLDIPVSYNSFDEFKTEFIMVLNSDEARRFNAH